MLLSNFTNHRYLESREHVLIHVLLATVSPYTRSWYRALSAQSEPAQLHDAKHRSYINSFFPVKKLWWAIALHCLASWEGVCCADSHRYSFMLAQTPWQECWSAWQKCCCTQESLLCVSAVLPTALPFLAEKSQQEALLEIPLWSIHGSWATAHKQSQCGSQRGAACGVLAVSPGKLLRLP